MHVRSNQIHSLISVTHPPFPTHPFLTIFRQSWDESFQTKRSLDTTMYDGGLPFALSAIGILMLSDITRNNRTRCHGQQSQQ